MNLNSDIPAKVWVPSTLALTLALVFGLAVALASRPTLNSPQCKAVTPIALDLAAQSKAFAAQCKAGQPCDYATTQMLEKRWKDLNPQIDAACGTNLQEQQQQVAAQQQKAEEDAQKARTEAVWDKYVRHGAGALTDAECHLIFFERGACEPIPGTEPGGALDQEIARDTRNDAIAQERLDEARRNMRSVCAQYPDYAARNPVTCSE